MCLTYYMCKPIRPSTKMVEVEPRCSIQNFATNVAKSVISISFQCKNGYQLPGSGTG